MPHPTLAFLQARYSTAGTLLNDVAKELQLTPQSDPVASIDPTFLKLQAMAKVLGRDLLRKHNWQLFTRLYTFTTNDSVPAPGPATYPLPTDYFKTVDQTNWNKTSQLPMFGPVDPGMWEWLTSTLSNGLTLYLGFRLWGDVFAVYPAPNPDAQEIGFEYMSRNWVQPSGTEDDAVRTDGFTASGDLVLYDPNLFTRGLKMRWLVDAGLDSSAAAEDFATAWEAVVGPDAGAQILNFARPPLGIRYLDPRSNVPEGSWGS